jgi:hypothetical protein
MKYRPAVSGDVGDSRLVVLDGIDDLTTVSSIEAHVWRRGMDPVTLTAAVTDAIARTVTVQLGTSGGWLPTAEPGMYNVEIEATLGSTVLTWPNGAPDQLEVRAQGD